MEEFDKEVDRKIHPWFGIQPQIERAVKFFGPRENRESSQFPSTTLRIQFSPLVHPFSAKYDHVAGFKYVYKLFETASKAVKY